MNLKQFIIELTEQGVNLWTEGEQLRVRAAQGVITPDLRDKLALHKADIVKLLQKKSNASDTSIPQVLASLRRNLPLSFAQEGLWFLSQLEPNNPFYNEALALRLHGSLNVVALEKSLNKIIQRHEVLRTNFAMAEGQPVQVIAENLTLSVQVLNLGELPDREREIAWRRKAMAQIQQPFDLSSSGLIRASVLKLTQTEHILLLTIHHIVCDAPSGGLLVRELAAFYTAYCNDLPLELPELPIQYADFAVWQRQRLQGDVLESQLAYWKQQLEGAPALLELPTDRVRPSIQTFRGARYRQALSKELTEALMILSRRQKVTLFMTLLAALKTLLYRYTGQSDICVGTPYTTRERPEIEGLIGLFVNTLVLRTDISGNPSFEELLLRVREVALGAYAHADLPFEKLVEQLQPARSLSYTPLCQVMLNLYPPISQIGMDGLTVSRVAVETGTAKFDLSLSFFNTDSGLIGDWEYNTDLFDASTIARMASHFQTLLEGIVANPQEQVSQLPLLTERERHQLLVEWNNTTKEYPIDKCIHQLFEEQVERSPDAIAVVFVDARSAASRRVDKQLTYRELNKRANRIAHHLKTLGVGPEVLVGICVERSLEMIAGLLGILKAGGAYVPIDPTYPSERIAYMLYNSQVPVLLTQHHLTAILPEYEGRVLSLDSDWDVIAAESEENPVSGVTPENLIYIIYTSGSTGKPKGAGVYHQGFTNLVNWFSAEFRFTTEDCVLITSSVSFDLTQKNFYAPLIVGGQLHLLPSAHYDPQLVSQLIEQHKITWLNCAPSVFYPLIEPNNDQTFLKLASLRYVFLGGEPISLPRLWIWLQSVSCQTQIVNSYGPTECTDVSTAYRLHDPASFLEKAIPIGRPIFNVKNFILDKSLELTPVGVVGELYIGGEGVGAGYLNNPEMTDAKFIEVSFNNDQKVLLYKTGDLARYRPDGNIEFLGRIDNQVKIRGFRIELGEIEAVLTQHPEVDQAVVVVNEDQPGNNRLVAYIVSTERLNSIEDLTHKIKTYLRQQLPEYMVPATLMILSALPLTPNGKVDRRALPPPEPVRRSLALEMPQTKVEKLIAEVWQKILLLEKVGRDDNFFDIGGNSLRLIQVREKLQIIFTKELSMVEMFQHPTVRALGQLLSEQKSSQTPDAPKSEAERAEVRNSSQGSMNQRRNIRQQYRSPK